MGMWLSYAVVSSSLQPHRLIRQTPLSMEFSRQEYCSGLSFPTPKDLPDSGIEPASPASLELAAGFFTTSATWEAGNICRPFWLPGLPCWLRWWRIYLTMWESWVLSLGQEDPLEKGMATHSSILVWRIQWAEEPGGLQSMGWQRVGHDWATANFPFFHVVTVTGSCTVI